MFSSQTGKRGGDEPAAVAIEASNHIRRPRRWRRTYMMVRVRQRVSEDTV